jgi:Fur family transcriptional regulator, ferric uptake regulator
MKAAYLHQFSAAEAGIRATGERLTQPRAAVLAYLLASERATSHLDIAHALAEHHAVDRVTVYRVLEWLVNKGMAHRIAGDDRVWRFMVNPQRAQASDEPRAAHGHHAHFTCEACGHTVCLEKAPKFDLRLPKGFRSTEIDLHVRGRCAHCP